MYKHFTFNLQGFSCLKKTHTTIHVTKVKKWYSLSKTKTPSFLQPLTQTNQKIVS